MYNRSVGAADREGAVMRSTRRFEEDEVSATVSRDGWEGRKKGGWDVGGAHEASTKEDGWMDGRWWWWCGVGGQGWRGTCIHHSPVRAFQQALLSNPGGCHTRTERHIGQP